MHDVKLCCFAFVQSAQQVLHNLGSLLFYMLLVHQLGLEILPLCRALLLIPELNFGMPLRVFSEDYIGKHDVALSGSSKINCLRDKILGINVVS